MKVESVINEIKEMIESLEKKSKLNFSKSRIKQSFIMFY